MRDNTETMKRAEHRGIGLFSAAFGIIMLTIGSLGLAVLLGVRFCS